MIKHFDLKLNCACEEKLGINPIAIGDIQTTIIGLLNRNTGLSGNITSNNFSDSFYQGGKN